MFVEARNSLIGIVRYFGWRSDASSYFVGTGGAFARSLVAYVLAFPFAMVTAYWDAALETRPRIDILGWTIYVVEFVANAAVMLGIAFLAAWLLGRRGNFYRYGTAANWHACALALVTFCFLAVGEKTDLHQRDDAIGHVADVFGLLFLVAFLYWFWAILHQALKFRWWQSLPIAAVIIVVSIVISTFATVAVRIESAPAGG